MWSDISDADFKESVKKGATFVVVFSSPWCGVCQGVARRLQALSPKYENLIFRRMDVVSNAETASGLGVLSIPTVVFFKGGEEKSRISGDVSEKEFEKGIQGIL